jgi:hypothetical protein
VDKYEIGDYVLREAPSGTVTQLLVTDPYGHTVVGNMATASATTYYWHMIASTVGVWRLTWRMVNVVDFEETFEVTSERVW